VVWFVEWGLAHRQLRGVESIGVDEIHWGHGLKADNFLTVIYQCKSLRPRPALLASKLATARAWELKETVSCFWKYKSMIWAGGFLDYWCFRAIAPLILNWFRSRFE
jgi:hypothetical protein